MNTIPHNAAQPAQDAKEFRLLRQSGMIAGSSKAIGLGFMAARNAIARGLIRIGATPNHVTVAGFAANCGAAACFFMGAGHHAPWEAPVAGVTQSYWPLCGTAWLFVAGACDMIDGAVARIGNMHTAFGGLLDSTLDRCSEIAVYTGMALHFAVAGNVTYLTLAILALCHGTLISYVKARAEEYIDDCSIGFWKRGERCAAVFLASISAHLPIMLWQQAVSPLFTWLLRLRYARAAIRAKEAGLPPPPIIPPRTLSSLLKPWRYPRGTVPYDLTVGFHIACFTVLPWLHPVFYGGGDPLRSLLTNS